MAKVGVGKVGVESLGGRELIVATRDLVRRSSSLEAEILAHLGEIDARRLYLDCAYPSMFAFCVEELGLSEDAAYNRITVARAARRLPAILPAIESGAVHLTGMRLLVPHLTPENHRAVLDEATGKSRREIEEMVARFSSWLPIRFDRRASIMPLGEGAFEIRFTGDSALRDKIYKAQALLRHRVPDGNLTEIFSAALDALVAAVEKERFGVGARPRKRATAAKPASRYIPKETKRTVYKRDEGRCTYVDERGKRCGETGFIEFDHVPGFARTRSHKDDEMRLLCRAHNQHAAEKLYGRAFMEESRGAAQATRPGTSARAQPP